MIRFPEAGAYTRAPEQVKRAGLLGRSIFWKTCLGVLRARALTDASWAAWTQGGAQPLPAPSGLQGLALWRGPAAPVMLRACHCQTPGVRPRPGSASAGHGRAPTPPNSDPRAPGPRQRRHRNRNRLRACGPLVMASRDPALAPGRGDAACRPMASRAATPQPSLTPRRLGPLELEPRRSRGRLASGTASWSRKISQLSSLAEASTFPHSSGAQVPPVPQPPRRSLNTIP